jgi:hypothetical protein
MTRMRPLAVLENLATITVFACIVIWAPGGWKWAGLLVLTNLNQHTSCPTGKDTAE